MKPHNIPYRLWWQYNYHFVLEHILGYETFVKTYGKKHKRLIEKIDMHLQDRHHITPPAAEGIVQDGNAPGEKDLSKPILYRAKAAGWAGTQKWDLNYFSENYGDKEIIINDNKAIVDKRDPQQFEKLKLRDYISQIRQGTLKYLKFSSLVQKEKSLQNDLDLHSLRSFLLPTSFGETLYMFMGGKGSITPMHDEIVSNVYVQISGQKKWVLYPTEDRIFLNPRAERYPFFSCQANPDDLDNPDFPLQKYARKIEVILNPGDVLKVPPFYWHYIENMTDSIGVAYKFVNLPSAVSSSKLLTLLFFLSTRPSIFYVFVATRLKKDDYYMTKKEADLI